MGLTYQDLKNTKKKNIILEKKESIEIKQNFKGFFENKKTFTRERFFSPIKNKERYKNLGEREENNRISKGQGREKNLKQERDTQEERLKNDREKMSEQKKVIKSHIKEKNEVNHESKEAVKTWADQLAGNTSPEGAQESCYLKKDNVSTLRSIRVSSEQGGQGDHNSYLHLNLKGQGSVKNLLKECLLSDLSIKKPSQLTINCCYGLSQPLICTYPLHYQCQFHDNQQMPVVTKCEHTYCHDEYYFDCGNCACKPVCACSCKATTSKCHNRRQNTDLDTQHFYCRSSNRSRSPSSQRMMEKSRRKEKQTENFKDKKSGFNKTKAGNEKSPPRAEKFGKLLSENEASELIKQIDRYIDEGEKVAQIKAAKRQEVTNDSCSFTTTTATLEFKTKRNNSSKSHYSFETLEMLKKIKILDYKASKRQYKMEENEAKTNKTSHNQEKIKNYQKYIEQFAKEVEVLKEPTRGERNTNKKSNEEGGTTREQYFLKTFVSEQKFRDQGESREGTNFKEQQDKPTQTKPPKANDSKQQQRNTQIHHNNKPVQQQITAQSISNDNIPTTSQALKYFEKSSHDYQERERYEAEHFRKTFMSEKNFPEKTNFKEQQSKLTQTKSRKADDSKQQQNSLNIQIQPTAIEPAQQQQQMTAQSISNDNIPTTSQALKYFEKSSYDYQERERYEAEKDDYEKFVEQLYRQKKLKNLNNEKETSLKTQTKTGEWPEEIRTGHLKDIFKQEAQSKIKETRTKNDFEKVKYKQVKQFSPTDYWEKVLEEYCAHFENKSYDNEKSESEVQENKERSDKKWGEYLSESAKGRSFREIRGHHDFRKSLNEQHRAEELNQGQKRNSETPKERRFREIQDYKQYCKEGQRENLISELEKQNKTSKGTEFGGSAKEKPTSEIFNIEEFKKVLHPLIKSLRLKDSWAQYDPKDARHKKPDPYPVTEHLRARRLNKAQEHESYKPKSHRENLFTQEQYDYEQKEKRLTETQDLRNVIKQRMNSIFDNTKDKSLSEPEQSGKCSNESRKLSEDQDQYDQQMQNKIYSIEKRLSESSESNDQKTLRDLKQKSQALPKSSRTRKYIYESYEKGQSKNERQKEENVGEHHDQKSLRDTIESRDRYHYKNPTEFNKTQQYLTGDHSWEGRYNKIQNRYDLGSPRNDNKSNKEYKQQQYGVNEGSKSRSLSGAENSFDQKRRYEYDNNRAKEYPIFQDSEEKRFYQSQEINDQKDRNKSKIEKERKQLQPTDYKQEHNEFSEGSWQGRFSDAENCNYQNRLSENEKNRLKEFKQTKYSIPETSEAGRFYESQERYDQKNLKERKAEKEQEQLDQTEYKQKQNEFIEGSKQRRFNEAEERSDQKSFPSRYDNERPKELKQEEYLIFKETEESRFYERKAQKEKGKEQNELMEATKHRRLSKTEERYSLPSRYDNERRKEFKQVGYSICKESEERRFHETLERYDLKESKREKEKLEHTEYKQKQNEFEGSKYRRLSDTEERYDQRSLPSYDNKRPKEFIQAEYPLHEGLEETFAPKIPKESEAERERERKTLEQTVSQRVDNPYGISKAADQQLKVRLNDENEKSEETNEYSGSPTSPKSRFVDSSKGKLRSAEVNSRHVSQGSSGIINNEDFDFENVKPDEVERSSSNENASEVTLSEAKQRSNQRSSPTFFKTKKEQESLDYIDRVQELKSEALVPTPLSKQQKIPKVEDLKKAKNLYTHDLDPKVLRTNSEKENWRYLNKRDESEMLMELKQEAIEPNQLCRGQIYFLEGYLKATKKSLKDFDVEKDDLVRELNSDNNSDILRNAPNQEQKSKADLCIKLCKQEYLQSELQQKEFHDQLELDPQLKPTEVKREKVSQESYETLAADDSLTHNDFKLEMDHNLAVYNHCASQTVSKKIPKQTSTKEIQAEIEKETLPLCHKTDDVLNSLKSFLKSYPETQKEGDKCFNLVIQATEDLINKLSSCKSLGEEEEQNSQELNKELQASPVSEVEFKDAETSPKPSDNQLEKTDFQQNKDTEQEIITQEDKKEYTKSKLLRSTTQKETRIPHKEKTEILQINQRKNLETAKTAQEEQQFKDLETSPEPSDSHLKENEQTEQEVKQKDLENSSVPNTAQLKISPESSDSHLKKTLTKDKENEQTAQEVKAKDFENSLEPISAQLKLPPTNEQGKYLLLRRDNENKFETLNKEENKGISANSTIKSTKTEDSNQKIAINEFNETELHQIHMMQDANNWQTKDNYQSCKEYKGTLSNAAVGAEFDIDLKNQQTYSESEVSRTGKLLGRQSNFDPDLVPLKGILKSGGLSDITQAGSYALESYKTRSVVNDKQRDFVNIQKESLMSYKLVPDNLAQEINNEDMQVINTNDSSQLPVVQQSKLRFNETNVIQQLEPICPDCQLEDETEIDNDYSACCTEHMPPFRQCPCMWDTYVQLMNNYYKGRSN